MSVAVLAEGFAASAPRILMLLANPESTPNQRGESMRFLVIASLAAFLLLGTLGCDLEQPLAPDVEEEVLPSPTNRSASGKKASSAGVDPFADSVVEDGVNDQGQGFPDPAGILGNLEVLDPAKSPPVTGLVIGGFAVQDMVEGEEITKGQVF